MAAPYLMRIVEQDSGLGMQLTALHSLGALRPSQASIANFLALWGGLAAMEHKAVAYPYCHAMGAHGVDTPAVMRFLRNFSRLGEIEYRMAKETWAAIGASAHPGGRTLVHSMPERLASHHCTTPIENGP